MRKESGVTLIALVITIIVLIILAGVSITSLTDEDKGVVTKAKEAAVKTEEAAEQEDEDIREILDYADSELEEEVYYIVTFSYKNSSGVTVIEKVQVISGGNVTTTPNVPSYISGSTTYTFANKWVTTSGGSTEASLTNITSNKTVYAVYTVSTSGSGIITHGGGSN